jgi:oligosaccharide reducing-end xylanase
LAARGGRGGIESSTPESFMDINSIDCGNAEYSLNTLDDFKETFENTATSNGWCILAIHGIDDDGGYSPLSSTILDGSLQYLDGLKSKYWITTFLDAVRYIKERNGATIREISSQGNSFTIQVTDNLPDSIYNLPITIRRPLPAAWSTAYAEQDGKLLISSITIVNSIRYIMFDVVPDNGNIIIKPDIITPPSNYEIGTWNGFRSAAITYTFDDGSSNQYAKAIPIFDKYGYKLTLFTVTEWVSDWSKLVNAAAKGHEVASHTVSHPNLHNLNFVEQTNELKNSRNIINNHISGQKCMTIAYPYCIKSEDSITSKYYIAARGGDGKIESSTPASFMDIKSIDCGSGRYELNTLDDFIETFESTDILNGWCILTLHGIDNDGGYSPLSSTILNSTLQYLNKYSNKYWVSTFSNTVQYIKERNNAVVKEILAQGNSFTIQLTDNLPDSIYNYPITIRRPLPASWQSAYVEQNGKQLPSLITVVNSMKYIMFDAVPDNGNILIRQDRTSINLSGLNSDNSVNVKIGMRKSQLTLESDIFSRSPYDITIFDLKGAVVARHKVNNVKNNARIITLPSDGIKRSNLVYIVRISNSEHVWTGQLR